MDYQVGLFTGLIRTRKQFGFPVFGMRPAGRRKLRAPISDQWAVVRPLSSVVRFSFSAFDLVLSGFSFRNFSF